MSAGIPSRSTLYWRWVLDQYCTGADGGTTADSQLLDYVQNREGFASFFDVSMYAIMYAMYVILYAILKYIII